MTKMVRVCRPDHSVVTVQTYDQANDRIIEVLVIVSCPLDNLKQLVDKGIGEALCNGEGSEMNPQILQPKPTHQARPC